MEWDFQVQSKNFYSCIFTKAKIETLGEGIIVTGNGESLLLQHASLGFSVCDEA